MISYLNTALWVDSPPDVSVPDELPMKRLREFGHRVPPASGRVETRVGQLGFEPRTSRLSAERSYLAELLALGRRSSS